MCLDHRPLIRSAFVNVVLVICLSALGGKQFQEQLQQASFAATLGEISTPELLRRRKEREEQERLERLKGLGKSSFVRTHAKLVAAGKQQLEAQQQQQQQQQVKGASNTSQCSDRPRNSFARVPARQARTGAPAATIVARTAAARSALQAKAQPEGVSKEELKQVSSRLVQAV